MSVIKKLIKRLLSEPNDFTYQELIKVLSHYGFKETKKSKTGGSRRKFVDDKLNVICIHKPHPGNIVEIGALKETIQQLKEKDLLQNE